MKKNIKLSEFFKFRKVLMMLMLSGVLSLTACGKKEEQAFSETLEEVQEFTCLDDVIKANDDNILDDVSELEKYLNLSDEMAEMELSNYSISLDVLNESTLLPASNVEKLLEDYSDDKNNVELLYDAVVQTHLVNNFILEDGYDICANISLLTLKAKMADAFEYDVEKSVELANSIKFSSVEETYYNSPYAELFVRNFYVDGYKVHINEKLVDLLDMVYDLQHNTGHTGYDYNKERNRMISNDLNYTKKILSSEQKIKIKQYQ